MCKISLIRLVVLGSCLMTTSCSIRLDIISGNRSMLLLHMIYILYIIYIYIIYRIVHITVLNRDNFLERKKPISAQNNFQSTAKNPKHKYKTSQFNENELKSTQGEKILSLWSNWKPRFYLLQCHNAQHSTWYILHFVALAWSPPSKDLHLGRLEVKLRRGCWSS